MATLEGVKTNCECQYTLKLTNALVQGQFAETKDNYNSVPSIHEVDEDETDEEDICDQEPIPKDREQIANTRGNENESIYDDESFCSEESCEEFDEATSRTVTDSQFSYQITDRKGNKEDTAIEEESKSLIEDNEVENLTDCKSFISDDRSMRLKQVKNRRRNMSFTDEEIRKIEWENQILLRKIMAQQRPKEKILGDSVPQSMTSSSAINRKKLQKKIETENILLLQRIQQTKSRVMNNATKPGCRQTLLQ